METPKIEEKTERSKRSLRLEKVPAGLEGLIRLIACRLSLLFSVLISATIVFFSSGQNDPELIHSISFDILLTFLAFAGCSLVWLPKFGSHPWFRIVQLGGDLLLITWVVYITGGSVSPFLFLYLPLVMATALLLSRNAALAAALLSILIYGALVALMMYGYIGENEAYDHTMLPSGGLTFQVLGLLSAMALVAVATNFLTGALQSSHALVERSQRDIIELNSRQRELIEGVSDGVVTTLEDFTIVSMNRVAGTILGKRHTEVVGRHFVEALASLSAAYVQKDPNSKEFTIPQEIELRGGPGSSRRFISLSGRVLRGEESASLMLLFILKDVTALREIEQKLAMQERMARLLSEEQSPEQSATAIPDFVGESIVMRKVFSLIERVAPSDATVLVTGESGTGKELVAKAIHVRSQRSTGPFITVNCGAIPENLIESELFGHKKGSFTGAISEHLGLFRRAQGGTLFLDEIGELPLALQAKLLRTLQERIVRAVGGDHDIEIDVRIIAATNRDLKEQIINGRFREDLYYRLNVIHLALPPLRDRKDDIPLLVRSIVSRNRKTDAVPIISPGAMELLLAYSYPGNVRELENILERALVLGGEVVLPDHLPEMMRELPLRKKSAPVPGGLGSEEWLEATLELPIDLEKLLQGIERRYLTKALEESAGVRKEAARLLGINFRSLRYRLQKFDIGDGRDEPESSPTGRSLYGG